MKAISAHTFITLTTIALIILWIYAGASKLIDLEASRAQMLMQVFPEKVNLFLTWAVPLVELIAALLLISHKTVVHGLILSFILLMSLSIYITLIMTSTFEDIPCSCGGIISSLSWGEHLLFNLVFLGITLVALILHVKKEVTAMKH